MTREGDIPFAEADFVVVGGGSAGWSLPVVSARIRPQRSSSLKPENEIEARTSICQLALQGRRSGIDLGHQTAPSPHQDGIVTSFPQPKVPGRQLDQCASLYPRHPPGL